MWKSALRVCGTLGILYLILVLFLAGCQRHLIYYPVQAQEETMIGIARNMGIIPWRDPSGSIIGWRTTADGLGATDRRAVVFHGNAGYALHRGYFLEGFRGESSGWEVFLFEYPGYGARPGRPEEKQIVTAAVEAVAQLLDEGDSPLFLVGESLGSGVAAQVAAACQNQISGLLLITPFTRLADVAQTHYPIFPVKLLLRDHYDTAKALKSYSGPVAFVVAERDEVVSAELGLRLYEGFDGKKMLQVLEGTSHNTINYRPATPWWRESLVFLKGDG